MHALREKKQKQILYTELYVDVQNHC